MDQNIPQCKDDILRRLRRIEGQVKGIQRMIEQERGCADILIQIAAVRAAINKTGGLILENYSQKCLQNVAEGQCGQSVNEMMDVILKFIK